MILTTTFILFVAGVLFFGTIPFISNYSRRKKEKICRLLSREGDAHGLIFCSQEVLDNKVIGFDGIHRKIMVIEQNRHKYHSSIISLDEVQQCQLVTPEGVVNPANRNKVDNDALELRFQFSNSQQSASIRFTNGFVNSKRELALLRAKAEYWCVMFSKMLNTQVGVRA